MEYSKSLDIQTLLSKPVWQMTGEEFCQLSMFAAEGKSSSISSASDGARAIGMHELGVAIGCCDSTVYSLKKQGVLDEAIISQIGKKIVFDVEKARVLAQAYQQNQREARREARGV